VSLGRCLTGQEVWTKTAVKPNAFGIFERKIVRGIYGLVKRWRMKTNNDVKDILRGDGVLKFMKSF
jgi:hypothetical protein